MKTTNIKIGNDCEELVENTMRNHGYWVYVTPHKVSGQPVDCICCRNDIIWLFDVKHVRTEIASFDLSRIEPNQWATLGYARNFANIKHLGFAIYFERKQDIYWLSYDKAVELKNKKIKSINLLLLERFEDIIK